MREYHDSTCPITSFAPRACECGFVQEFLAEPGYGERLRAASSVPVPPRSGSPQVNVVSGQHIASALAAMCASVDMSTYEEDFR